MAKKSLSEPKNLQHLKNGDGYKMTVYISEITETPKLNLYRIWYSDGNDRDEIGRVSAKDIDQALEYAINQYLSKDAEIRDEDGDDQHLYLILNHCLDCDIDEIMAINEYEDKDQCCEYCELSAYLEIMLDEDAETEFKTIQGIDEYANLETGAKPYDYNALLAKAWRIDPQLGVDTLMYTTILENKELAKGIDPTYAKRITESAKKVNEYE